MVGSLMLWKLAHCKRLKNHSFFDAEENKTDLSQQTSTATVIKNEIVVSDTNYTCRVCLKDGHIPIYDNSRLADISEALSSFGGIEVRVDDDYPKYLCQQCHALLQGAILFRKTAQDSDQVLRCPPQEVLSDNDSYSDLPETSFVGKEIKNTKYHCKTCNIDFDVFEKYSEHRLSQEHENVRHTCQICKNTYSSLYFKKHMALHTSESSYVCDICGKRFVIKALFTRHRVTHFNNFPFKCSLCPYRGRFKESLKMHMRFHTGEKPYQCAHCASKFVSKSNLNKHMAVHKSCFDFKCDTCSRGFYTKRALDVHIKVDHTGVKDHVCNVCGKAFGYRKQMMKHQLKVHKREKFKTGRMPLYLQMESEQQEIQDDR